MKRKYFVCICSDRTRGHYIMGFSINKRINTDSFIRNWFNKNIYCHLLSDPREASKEEYKKADRKIFQYFKILDMDVS